MGSQHRQSCLGVDVKPSATYKSNYNRKSKYKWDTRNHSGKEGVV
jgi:hypothetical protein